MKISVVGWYGKKNVGDEAFRFVLSDFLEGHEVEFVTPPRLCNSPDIVILGGGAVVSPFYLNTLPDCPRYALGVDLAYESEADLMAKANFKEVYVRTQSDCDALKKKLTCPVHAIPDLAYYIQDPKKDILGQLRPNKNKKKFGVFVTDYVNPAIDRSASKFGDRAQNFITSLANELDDLSVQGYEIILIPCSTGGYGNDNRINLDLVAYMKNEPTLIMDTIHPQDMVGLIANLDIALCMRFHSHIFSMIAATPFVSIEFTRKVKLLLKENGIEELTAVRLKDNQFHWSELKEKIKAVESGNYPQKFNCLATDYRNQLVKVKEQVRRDWLKSNS